jgi:hypothetical protein
MLGGLVLHEAGTTKYSTRNSPDAPYLLGYVKLIPSKWPCDLPDPATAGPAIGRVAEARPWTER